MSRSLSLAAYRALSRRKFRASHIGDIERPDGELLWMHATSQDRLHVLCNLAARIKSQRPELKVLATVDQRRTDSFSPNGCDLLQVLGPDHPDQARQFLDHWRPDMCLWAGGDLMPNLITQARSRTIPMVLVDLAEDEVPARRSRWMPDLGRLTLGCFHQILVRDEAAAEVLRRAGFSSARVRVAGRLRTTATPPPCSDDLLDELSGDIGGRPVWFSVGTQPAEVDLVLEAHRNAVRLIHRLLLVIDVADPGDAVGLKDHIASKGMRCADWDDGDPIGEETQVVVSADPEALGLWYRIAPITFVASTFDRRPSGRNPFEPAALGSAVIHGPHTGNYPDAFARLDAISAAREVRNADQLSAQVVALSAPDQAARIALDAWKVATEGAELTDALIDLVQDMLDMREDTHAGP
ncbi:3-deoxy-D-manno-octulosonic acid transferase [Jhaorihella thermophila]|uniref:3-deoxy-D-manno-octulosonic acid transferase n=1 Tax=Jhaorihella thermophila TaxID=488547 RepID=A0A1H5UZK4_9RHOB|nr:glycosyltransferase N-terminal domain-containing protein [Jhaorihella thermophila]SEF79838.1 3-deoxy-D-manno-octulosonic-acid transferase [Jhaorihella thermophila]